MQKIKDIGPLSITVIAYVHGVCQLQALDVWKQVFLRLHSADSWPTSEASFRLDSRQPPARPSDREHCCVGPEAMNWVGPC